MGPDSHPPALRTETEPTLAELRRKYPGWEITRIFGGYEATPKGTPLVHAVYLSSMEEKLEALRAVYQAHERGMRGNSFANGANNPNGPARSQRDSGWVIRPVSHWDFTEGRDPS